jgi:phospholipid/cholesterol/gamma-HCH transport system substrate-binding protein
MNRYMRQTSLRVVALVVFFGAVLATLAVLYKGTGHNLPFESTGYQVSVTMDNVDNLVAAGQVQEAGVRIGKVDSVDFNGKGEVTVVMTIDSGQAPLHQGLKIRVGTRSLVGETYLDVTDGKGAAIASNTLLPESDVENGVQLHDVLASLDATTRGQLSALLQSAGVSTAGTSSSVDALMTALGNLGRNGNVALDALAAQSRSLTAMSRQTVAVLDALDTSNGQIVDLVQHADALTKATAVQDDAIRSTMQELPGVLGNASTASTSLSGLADALDPVAKDLHAAGPNLTTALNQLPSTLHDLHAMLAPLSGVLKEAPATLTKVPTLSSDLNTLIPIAMGTTSQVNPMLAYLKPYGADLASYFANFNAVLNYRDENGAYYLRLTPFVDTSSPQVPIKTNGLLGNYTNAYPGPHKGADPGPFTGTFPHIKALGN